MVSIDNVSIGYCIKKVVGEEEGSTCKKWVPCQCATLGAVLYYLGTNDTAQYLLSFSFFYYIFFNPASHNLFLYQQHKNTHMVSSPFSGRRGLVNLFKDASRSRNNSQSSLQLDNTSSQPTSSSPPQPQMSRSQSLYHHSRAPVAPPHSTESLSDRPLPSIPTSPSGLNSRSSSRGVAPDSKYVTSTQPQQRRTKDPAAALPPTPRQAKSGHGVPLSTKSKDTFYKRLSRAAVAAFNAPEVGNHHHHNNKKPVETDQDLAETYTAYLSLESSDISSSETSNIQHGGPSPSVHDNNHSTESRKSDNNNNHHQPTPSTTTTTTTTTNDSNKKKKKKGEKEDEQQDGGGLEERCQKLQYMLDAKESEYQKISTNFHKHMMVSENSNRMVVVTGGSSVKRSLFVPPTTIIVPFAVN